MNYQLRGSGPPVLLVHGLPTSGRLWDYVVPALEPAFTCVVVDLPGFGESPLLPDGSLDLARYAQELDAVREELGTPRWHVVGHDAGAAIVVHYAANYAGRVDRLALLSPPVFPELKPFVAFRQMRRPRLGYVLAPLVVNLTMGVLGAWLRRKGRSRASVAPIIASFRRPFRGPGGWRHFVYLQRWGDPAEVMGQTTALLPRITAPTLVVVGDQDPVVPVSFATRAGEIIAGSEVHVLDCGHFIPLTCPAELCKLLVPFLERGTTAAEPAEPSTAPSLAMAQ